MFIKKNQQFNKNILWKLQTSVINCKVTLPCFIYSISEGNLCYFFPVYLHPYHTGRYKRKKTSTRSPAYFTGSCQISFRQQPRATVTLLPTRPLHVYTHHMHTRASAPLSHKSIFATVALSEWRVRTRKQHKRAESSENALAEEYSGPDRRRKNATRENSAGESAADMYYSG